MSPCCAAGDRMQPKKDDVVTAERKPRSRGFQQNIAPDYSLVGIYGGRGRNRTYNLSIKSRNQIFQGKPLTNSFYWPLRPDARTELDDANARFCWICWVRPESCVIISPYKVVHYSLSISVESSHRARSSDFDHSSINRFVNSLSVPEPRQHQV
jgi:hypothetical protein